MSELLFGFSMSSVVSSRVMRSSARGEECHGWASKHTRSQRVHSTPHSAASDTSLSLPSPRQAKTAIAPLDRVKILFQAQNPEFQKYSGRWLGVFTAAGNIVSTQGPAALFQGHSATLLRIFPYAAIKYMAYDKLHFVSTLSD